MFLLELALTLSGSLAVLAQTWIMQALSMIPNIDNILAEVMNNRDQIHQALNQGTFARVLQTNSRMPFRSVLPILQLPFHTVDGNEKGEHEGIKRRRLGAQLTAVGSFKDMMDHAPRFYMNQNSIGRLTTRMQSNLLQQAFVYHLNSSVDSLGQCNIEAVDKNKSSELKLIKTMQQDLRPCFHAIEGNKDNAGCRVHFFSWTHQPKRYIKRPQILGLLWHDL